MTKPDDIPQDVWEKAYKVIEVYYGFGSESFRVGLREAIARAIMAAKAEERESCAQIADRLNGWGADFGRGGHAEHISAHIRKRGESD